MLGMWVLISPWVLGASSITLMLWSNAVVGTALVLVSLWRLFGAKGGSRDAK